MPLSASNPPFALFVEPSTGLAVAIQTYQNQSSADLLLSLSVPQSYGWGAVGIGDRMAGSTMFITYPSGSTQNATLSVRSAGGHSTPSPIHNADCQIMSSSVDGSFMRTVFTCYGLGGDRRLRHQPEQVAWIWAVGPGAAIESSSDDAGISQHETFGKLEAIRP